MENIFILNGDNGISVVNRYVIFQRFVYILVFRCGKTRRRGKENLSGCVFHGYPRQRTMFHPHANRDLFVEMNESSISGFVLLSTKLDSLNQCFHQVSSEVIRRRAWTRIFHRSTNVHAAHVAHTYIEHVDHVRRSHYH